MNFLLTMRHWVNACELNFVNIVKSGNSGPCHWWHEGQGRPWRVLALRRHARRPRRRRARKGAWHHRLAYQTARHGWYAHQVTRSRCPTGTSQKKNEYTDWFPKKRPSAPLLVPAWRLAVSKTAPQCPLTPLAERVAVAVVVCKAVLLYILLVHWVNTRTDLKLSCKYAG